MKYRATTHSTFQTPEEKKLASQTSPSYSRPSIEYVGSPLIFLPLILLRATSTLTCDYSLNLKFFLRCHTVSSYILRACLYRCLVNFETSHEVTSYNSFNLPNPRRKRIGDPNFLELQQTFYRVPRFPLKYLASHFALSYISSNQ